VTFKSMLKDQLPMSIVQQISNITYSPSFSKINVAVNKLPAFKFLRSPSTTTTTTRVVTHFHRASILLNCELMEDLVAAQKEAEEQKTYSSKPLIQMTIPSVVDQTLSPWGSHVVELTCHYTPYSPAPGKVWDSNVKNEYANKVFDQVEHYCPGFWESIIAFDILTPPDMEHEYSLTGGAATHSDLTVDQIYFNRPSPHFSDYRSIP
jgi:phytoene dehydrogenase-like protein